MASKTAVVLETDGSSREVQPENGESFTLAELYRHVETDIVEMVYLEDGRFLVVDEEGLLRDEVVPNLEASLLTNKLIVGTVLLCEEGMVR